MISQSAAGDGASNTSSILGSNRAVNSNDVTGALAALLQWYADHGLVEPINAHATNKFDWVAPSSRNPVGTMRRNISPAAPPPMEPESRPAAALRETPTTYQATPTRSPLLSGDMPSTEVAIERATALAAAAPDIDQLRKIITASQLCELKAGARNTVIDDGVFGSDLLILGEAPGQEEDRIGRPFVGRAGQLLDLMLAAIGRDRSKDVYITNVVYWRPPGNRTPTKGEIAVCLPFVKRVIELARPKLILTAGNVPTKALFPALPGITRARGRKQIWHLGDGSQIPVLPLLHPAFLLRQPVQKGLAWQDMKTARALLRR